jgi:hypothetical protein
MKKWIFWTLIAWGAFGPVSALVIVLWDMHCRLGELEDHLLEEQTRGAMRDMRIEDSFEVSRRCCTP